MPFFRSRNILFIHIPKTGGSSVELYFCAKTNTSLDELELFSPSKSTLWNHSSQHATYQEINEKQSELNIDLKTVQIWTVVRNPYERAISDLFHLKMIHLHSSPEEVYQKMKEYIDHPTTIDNHKLPQHHYVIDANGKQIPNLIILKNETLNQEMHQRGYIDFWLDINKTYRGVINYYDYMNESFISLINEYYDKDFEMFGYAKINSNSSST